MACWSWTWASNLPAAAVMLFAAATSSYNRAPKASSVQFMNTSFHAEMLHKELWHSYVVVAACKSSTKP